MFADVAERTRAYQQRRIARIRRRREILFTQDQITMAVYHRRPQQEITNLLKRLERLTKKEN